MTKLFKVKLAFATDPGLDPIVVTEYVYADDQFEAERSATANVEENHPEATDVWLRGDPAAREIDRVTLQPVPVEEVKS